MSKNTFFCATAISSYLKVGIIWENIWLFFEEHYSGKESSVRQKNENKLNLQNFAEYDRKQAIISKLWIKNI